MEAFPSSAEDGFVGHGITDGTVGSIGWISALDGYIAGNFKGLLLFKLSARNERNRGITACRNAYYISLRGQLEGRWKGGSLRPA